MPSVVDHFSAWISHKAFETRELQSRRQARGCFVRKGDFYIQCSEWPLPALSVGRLERPKPDLRRIKFCRSAASPTEYSSTLQKSESVEVRYAVRVPTFSSIYYRVKLAVTIRPVSSQLSSIVPPTAMMRSLTIFEPLRRSGLTTFGPFISRQKNVNLRPSPSV